MNSLSQTLQRKPVMLALMAVIAVAAAGFFFFSGPPGAASSATAAGSKASPKPALTVTAAQPQSTVLPLTLSANGSISAWQEAVIGTESNGLRLTQVLVNVGDVVKAGQLLATFSTDSVQADVAQANASLVEAQASARDAADNAARARTLQSSGALSTQQINQYLTAEQTAKARAEAAQAVLGAQQLRGRQTQVLAPDSGVISSRSATVGSVVGSGTELFRLVRQGRLEWRAEVTSSELGRIAPGTAVTVRPASGGTVPGRVRMVAPTVDPQTRYALVYVDLPPMKAATGSRVGAPNEAPHRPKQSSAPSGGSAVREATNVGASGRSAGPPQARPAPSGGSEPHAVGSVGAPLPGMFAGGEFELGSSTALTIPQRALVVRDGFNHVFRLSPDNRVSQVKVQAGRLAGDRVEVVSGLAADARIVVDGAGFLNDGDLVRISEIPAPNRPAANAASAPAATKYRATQERLLLVHQKSDSGRDAVCAADLWRPAVVSGHEGAELPRH